MGIETALLALISQYGLPLTILVVLGWFGIKKLDAYFEHQKKKDEEHRQYMVERVEKSEIRQEELARVGHDLSKTNHELSETNRILVERFTIELGDIKEEVCETKHEVSKLGAILESKNK